MKVRSKEEQIKEISDLISLGNKRIDEPEDKAILILGATGAGKSTLTYLLAGEKLYSEQNEENNYVIKSKSKLGDIQIAVNGYASETRIPNKWQTSDGAILWDCPGFADTEGIEQEVANAFYIHRLFETTKNVKFVLAVSEHALYGKANEFVETLSNFTRMFKDVSMLEGSLALVITHAPKSKKVAGIQATLSNLVSQPNRLGEEAKKVLEFASKAVFLFHAPDGEQEDISNPKLLEEINAATQYIEVNNPFANVAISEKSLDTAYGLFDASNTILVDSLTSLAQLVINRCNVVNNPDNSYVEETKTEVKTESTTENAGNKPIIKRIWDTFFGKSSTALETVYETQYKQCYKELLDLDDICAFNDACKGIIQTNVKIDALIQNVDSIFRVLHKNAGVDQNQVAMQSSIHEKIKYVQFLELVCNGQKKVDINSLSQIFTKAQSALEEAADKGIKVINISTNEESYVYYEKIVNYLELPKYSSDQSCIETKAKALYYMGSIAFREKNYGLSVENYIKAIKSNKACKGFEDIYKKMADIFYDNPESLRSVEDGEIKEKLFGVSYERFVEVLGKISEQVKSTFQEGIPSYPGTKKGEGKLAILTQHLEYLDYLNYINKLWNSTKVLCITNSQSDFIQNIDKALNSSGEEYKKKFEQDIMPCKESFDIELKAVLFFNNLLSNSKNAEIDKWYDKVQEAHNLLKSNFVGAIKSIDIHPDIEDIDYLQHAIGYLSMLPNSKSALMAKAKAYFTLGNIHDKKGESELALDNYQKAVGIDNGLNDARKCMGEIKFKEGKFIEAYEFFSQVKDFIKVEDCFKQAIAAHPADANLREQRGDYLCGVGMCEKGMKSYTEAISLTSNNEAQKTIYKKMSDAARPSVREAIADKFLGMANGALDIFPQTNIVGDSDDFQDGCD